MTCSICQINQRVKARGFERYMRFIGNIKVGIISSSMNVIGSSRLLYLSQQFCLALQFAPGEWIGIELDAPEGKNNDINAVKVCVDIMPKCECIKGPYGPIAEWDVSRVTDLNNMFEKTPHFVGGISKWDVSKVTNMHGLFMNTKEFRGGISDWDVTSLCSHSITIAEQHTRPTSKKATTKRGGRLRTPQQRQFPVSATVP